MATASQALLKELGVEDLDELAELVRRGRVQRATEDSDVDLDLDVMHPRGRSFRFQGTVYHLPAEIPLPVVARAKQAHDVFRAKGKRRTQTDLDWAANELHALLMKCVRVHQPEAEDLDLGVDGTMRVFALMAGAPDGADLDEQLLRDMEVDGASTTQEGDVDELPPTPPNRASRRASGRSRKRSPAASRS